MTWKQFVSKFFCPLPAFWFESILIWLFYGCSFILKKNWQAGTLLGFSLLVFIFNVAVLVLTYFIFYLFYFCFGFCVFKPNVSQCICFGTDSLFIVLFVFFSCFFKLFMAQVCHEQIIVQGSSLDAHCTTILLNIILIARLFVEEVCS